MGAHIVDGQFQSDRFPTTPRGMVPLSVNSKKAQPFLWAFAQVQRSVDAEFSDDLETCLRAAGYTPPAMTDAWIDQYNRGYKNGVADTEDAEATRWQERIAETIRAAGLEPIDASGNESGDPLDWTNDQVHAALQALKELATDTRPRRVPKHTGDCGVWCDDRWCFEESTMTAGKLADQCANLVNYCEKLEVERAEIRHWLDTYDVQPRIDAGGDRITRESTEGTTKEDLAGRVGNLCTCIGLAAYQAAIARTKALEKTIEDANEALFDACSGDTEHQISHHFDTIDQTLRTVAAGAQKAIDVLQSSIQERVGG